MFKATWYKADLQDLNPDLATGEMCPPLRGPCLFQGSFSFSLKQIQCGNDTYPSSCWDSLLVLKDTSVWVGFIAPLKYNTDIFSPFLFYLSHQLQELRHHQHPHHPHHQHQHPCLCFLPRAPGYQGKQELNSRPRVEHSLQEVLLSALPKLCGPVTSNLPCASCQQCFCLLAGVGWGRSPRKMCLPPSTFQSMQHLCMLLD